MKLTAFVLAFSLVWGVANGQGNQTGLPATPPNNEPPATTAPSNQQMGQQTAKTPTPTLSIPPEGAPVNIYFNANNEGSEGGDKSQDTYTFLQVVIAGVVALFTGLLWHVGREQAGIYKKQATLMREALDASKESSERQLRAYVFDFEFSNNLKTVVEAGYKWELLEIFVIVKNLGQTPAYHAGISVGCRILPPQTTEEKQFLFIDHSEGHSTLGPTQTLGVTVKSDVPLTAQDIEDVSSGENRQLYVYGTVFYDDAFKKPRYTNFRFYTKFLGNRIEFFRTGKGNNTEEDDPAYSKPRQST